MPSALPSSKKGGGRGHGAAMPRYDVEAIRQARPWLEELPVRYGVELRRAGMQSWQGRCPFHQERTGSFTVYGESGTWKCYGCGAGGDAFSLFAKLEGLDVKAHWPEILARMAAMAGLGPMPEGWTPRERPAGEPRAARQRAVKAVRFPEVKRLGNNTCEELAALRGLSFAGVRAASEAGLIWGAVLGVSVRSGIVWGRALEIEGEKGKLAVGPVRCWMVWDGAGLGMSVRRLDGKPWPRRDGAQFKAWTVGTTKWPLGIRQVRPGQRIAVVEGGPDLLAAFHFLTMAKGPAGVAPVCLLHAGVHLHADALPLFEGRRVRIFAHFDRLQDTGKRAGWEAALLWQNTLTAAGAEVDTWSFEGLRQASGEPANDLNDAARGDAECLEEMRTAFDF